MDVERPGIPANSYQLEGEGVSVRVGREGDGVRIRYL